MIDSHAQPKRRWFQLRLATFFWLIFVAALSIALVKSRYENRRLLAEVLMRQAAYQRSLAEVQVFRARSEARLQSYRDKYDEARRQLYEDRRTP